MLTAREIFDLLRPCSWRYNNVKDLGDSINFGFIAQDILTNIGRDYNFVNESGDYLRVNYEQFIGVITAVVQENDHRLAQQEQRINQLEKKIEELTNGKHDL